MGFLYILNLYAPYQDKTIFWDRLEDADILKIDSLIVASNLNATTGLDECWGSTCKMDPMIDKLKETICDNN